MAINPVLARDAYTQELFPLPIMGEVFILKRVGISLKAETPNGTMKGSGIFFLTNRRIVFLKSGKPEQHKDFTSFEIPLHLMSEPRFEQPIFGANYMKGKVDPLTTAENPIGGTSKWFLTFNKGGCGTFLNVFFGLYKDAKRNYASSTTANFVNQLHQGANAAFVDPNDPSVLYVSQPVPSNPPDVYPSEGYPVLQPPPLPPVQTSPSTPAAYAGAPPPHPVYPPRPFEPRTPQFSQRPPSPTNQQASGGNMNQPSTPPYNPQQFPPPYSPQGAPPPYNPQGGPPSYNPQGGPPPYNPQGGPPPYNPQGGPPPYNPQGPPPPYNPQGAPPPYNSQGPPPPYYPQGYYPPQGAQ